ncbi:hypothetical protein CDAR_458731 [Caerostris darwini]|uniref:Uncharacterized protein n=1 Tax=Caerostris darwini TaxID=1538125 RepID=A0AAV4MSU1_9ARAC|nr:hypothetical protein CDAR_458731 [Caerostris darwini]
MKINSADPRVDFHLSLKNKEPFARAKHLTGLRCYRSADMTHSVFLRKSSVNKALWKRPAQGKHEKRSRRTNDLLELDPFSCTVVFTRLGVHEVTPGPLAPENERESNHYLHFTRVSLR